VKVLAIRMNRRLEALGCAVSIQEIAWRLAHFRTGYHQGRMSSPADVAALDLSVQHGEQLLDVVEVQARRGLIQDAETSAGGAAPIRDA
jgi:hypothetical protein